MSVGTTSDWGEGFGTTWLPPVSGLGPGAFSVVSLTQGARFGPEARDKRAWWAGVPAQGPGHWVRKKYVVGLRVMTNESSNNVGIWGPQWPTLSQTLHLVWD